MKCPKCEKMLGSVNIQKISASVIFGEKYHALAYVCPHCQSILNVGIDPVALNSDLVDDLVRALRKN
jgi:uncharacterized protein with PIN domain